MKTYRLASSSLVHTPGLIAWAVNGYKFPKDRPRLLEIVSSTWNLPRKATEALLSEKVKYTVHNETVIFTVETN